MRRDGRAADPLRPVRLLTDCTENPLGSVLCQVGCTLAPCTTFEERAVPRFPHGTGNGWVTAGCSMLPDAPDARGETTTFSQRPLGERTTLARAGMAQLSRQQGGVLEANAG